MNWYFVIEQCKDDDKSEYDNKKQVIKCKPPKERKEFFDSIKVRRDVSEPNLDPN